MEHTNLKRYDSEQKEIRTLEITYFIVRHIEGAYRHKI